MNATLDSLRSKFLLMSLSQRLLMISKKVNMKAIISLMFTTILSEETAESVKLCHSTFFQCEQVITLFTLWETDCDNELVTRLRSNRENRIR